ncbi:phosphoenolpyruvate carboxykinase (ATP) [bacterium]|nr:phosphoenolpyruvate carboxykinase (ATP) [bacterium]
MSDNIYNEEAYKRFAAQLPDALKGPNIERSTMDSLYPKAIHSAFRTRYGSLGWRSFVSSRIAAKTVYLGSERIRLPQISTLQKGLIKNAPEELDKVIHCLKTLPFVYLQRQMGDNDEFNPICNLFVCIADPKNYRIPYMWGNTMFKPSKRQGPQFTMIHIPEEHQMRQQVLTIPEYNLNIALGTDYMGEEKKGFLRQAMWCADEMGMLGLHAGTKLVIARDVKDKKLKTYGVFMFGLTATGKSTWSCHQLGLSHKDNEKTLVAQDDIVFLKKDGSAYGSEGGFYVKTDVVPEQQEAMYHALIDKTALLENVMINARGEIDFLDESLCGNGRAIVFRDRLRVKVGHKMVGISAKSINLPNLEELDGLIFAFITRRNTIMHFAQELTAEQAVLAYLWGESTHSFATVPEKAGESVRIVGTDDFIIGSRARKVNRFYEIIKTLTENYPGKVRFFQYNTGGVGEIIEKYEEGGSTKKKLVRKVDRVPLDIMSTIQRGDLRRSNQYAMGILGTNEISVCEGIKLDKYKPQNLYNQQQIDDYLRDLVKGRKEFTEEIIQEGLNPDIIKAAERSFRISPEQRKIEPVTISTYVPETKEKTKPYYWEPKSRPRRDFGR